MSDATTGGSEIRETFGGSTASATQQFREYLEPLRTSLDSLKTESQDQLTLFDWIASAPAPILTNLLARRYDQHELVAWLCVVGAAGGSLESALRSHRAETKSHRAALSDTALSVTMAGLGLLVVSPVVRAISEVTNGTRSDIVLPAALISAGLKMVVDAYFARLSTRLQDPENPMAASYDRTDTSISTRSSPDVV